MARLKSSSKKIPSRLDRKSIYKKRLKRLIMLLLVILMGAGIFVIWVFDIVPSTYIQLAESLGQSTKKYGLYVEKVIVRGRKETSLKEIHQCLGPIQDMPLLNVDMQHINICLHQLPWVKTVTISKRFPREIEIFVQEKKPMALWQHNKIIHVIAEDGSIVPTQPIGAFSKLPVLVGKGAPDHAPALLQELQEFPQIHDQVASSIRVSNRRWNLLMKNGITIRLPELDFSQALHQLDDFIIHHGLNAQEIKSIDFRIPGRLVLSLTKQGIAAFQKNKKGTLKQGGSKDV